MPCLKISTNVSKEKITEELNLHLCDFIAKMLGKPSGYCAVHIIPDQLMSFGGTFEPCAQVVLQSIGKLGHEENKRYSQLLSKELESRLSIPADRAYIFFHDVMHVLLFEKNLFFLNFFLINQGRKISAWL